MAKNDDSKKVSGVQKTAILLMCLGPDAAAKVMRKLTDAQIEQISAEIVTLGKINPELREQVLLEFNQEVTVSKRTIYGGVNFARNILEKSIGVDKATGIINRLGDIRTEPPFNFVRKADPAQLLNFIQSEHPQTIALILSHLDPNHSAIVLSALPSEQQAEVVRRIATMDKTTPEIIKEVEEVLQRRFSTFLSEGLTVAGGVKSVAEVLNRADRSTEKNIFEILEKENPGLADEIKKLMFVFEDLVLVDDRGIQQALKEMDNKELALALKTASDGVKEKIFKNMSKRAVESIKEEMEFMGAVRLKQVEEAQQRMVNIVRKLEERGEIVIQGRGGKGDEIVG